MSVAVTRPLSIPEVLDAGFQLYKRCLVKLLPLTLLAALISASSVVLFVPHSGPGGKMEHPAGFFGWMALYWLVTLSIYMALIRKTDDIAENRNQLSLADAYFGGLRKLPALIGATLLFGLIVTGGTVLLVIPGIIFMLSMSFYLSFLALEDKGPVDSLKCSHRLVWGHWWRWAAVYTVAVIIFIGLYVVVGFFAAIAGHVIGAGNAAFAAVITQAIAQLIISTVSTPFLISVQLIGFRELQLRKGGDDLAMRLAQAA